MAAIVPRADLEGVWIGGFVYQGSWVSVATRFDREAEGLVGAADVAFSDYEGERGVPLSVPMVEGPRVRFAIASRRGAILVDGRVNEGVLSGKYKFAKASGSFDVVRVVPMSPADRAPFYGAYELSPGHTLAVFEYAGTNLRFVDYESGQQSTLYPTSRDTFVSGPGQTMAAPVAHTFEFDRDAGGRVSSLRWQVTGKREQVARRVAYTEVPLTCTSGSVTLAGTLILPGTGGPYPAIVITPGDFGSNRDMLRGYAYEFVRRGIAALVFDSRGGGESTGEAASSSFDDLAGDVLAWVRVLRARAELDSGKIGLFGFSNSSWTIALAASKSAEVAFIVCQSTSAQHPWEQERFRAERQIELAGFPKDAVASAVQIMDRKFEVARTGAGWDSLQATLEAHEGEEWLPYTNPPSSLERLRAYWDRSFSYDPMPALTRLTCPSLFIFGALDSNVPVEATLPMLRSAIEQSGNKNVTIKVFPKARHDLIEGKNGGPKEFPMSRRFVPGYLDFMADWVAGRTLAGR